MAGVRPGGGASRPNVLVICVDEMRADHMGCAGHPVVRTPHLDRLAASGTLFSRACCNNPICMPARAAMFTGLLPRDSGLRVNGQCLHPGVPVLPEILAAAGYRTHAAGKLHLTPWVPRAPDAEAAAWPECMEFWNRGVLREFPTPYLGFQTVDFVGGHVSYAYGPYIRWLEARGGDRRQLGAEEALARVGPDTWKMALPEELHYNRYIADSTIRVIEESAAPGAAPFFAWCSFPDPHAPCAAPEPYCHLYEPADMPPPAAREGELEDLPPVYRRVLEGALKPNGVDNAGVTAGRVAQIRAMTAAMVTHLDAEVGRVLDALDRCGRRGDTLVVFVSDHGDMLGDHGLLWKSFYTFQGCIRIPLIVAAPGMPGGQRRDECVSQVDLLPTVLDWCGVEEPGARWAEAPTPFERGSARPLRLRPGASLLPLARGEAGDPGRAVVIENDDPTTGFRVRTLVAGRYRLSVYPGTPDGELFDLAADPDELHNLWYRDDRQRLRAELTERLLNEYAEAAPLYPVPPWNA